MNKTQREIYPPVVIVGLNDASLPIIRSLGRRGIRIIGLYDNPLEYATKSKFLSEKLFQKPLYDKILIDSLLTIARDLRQRAVLLCATDRSVLTVSKYEQQLNPYFHFVLPPYEVTSEQISKKRFQQFAINNSFLIPKAFFTTDPNGIKKVAERVSFPCVIKPEFRDKIWYAKVPSKVLYAESKLSFLQQIQQYQIQDMPLVIQDWIEGDDSNVYFCLVYISRKHKPLAIITGRKLAQHPHLTGSTSVAETICLPELADEALRLLRTAGCIGFCSVEFKLSNKNNRFYVTEPTVGRPDTQEGICFKAKLDIPYIGYLDAINRNTLPLRMMSVKKTIKWINEPLAFYTVQRYFENGPDLARLKSLFRGIRSYCYSAFDDPMPALTLIIKIIVNGFRKVSKKLPATSKKHLRGSP